VEIMNTDRPKVPKKRIYQIFQRYEKARKEAVKLAETIVLPEGEFIVEEIYCDDLLDVGHRWLVKYLGYPKPEWSKKKYVREEIREYEKLGTITLNEYLKVTDEQDRQERARKKKQAREELAKKKRLEKAELAKRKRRATMAAPRTTKKKPKTTHLRRSTLSSTSRTNRPRASRTSRGRAAAAKTTAYNSEEDGDSSGGCNSSKENSPPPSLGIDTDVDTGPIIKPRGCPTPGRRRSVRLMKL